ncbi:MAG: hypothetical protein WBC04_11435 [Candidatus Acidiferrales bacterium]
MLDAFCVFRIAIHRIFHMTCSGAATVWEHALEVFLRLGDSSGVPRWSGYGFEELRGLQGQRVD